MSAQASTDTAGQGTAARDGDLRFHSTEEISEFVRQFVDRSLPKERWTHRAHLVVGLWHLLHHSPEESLDLLRGRIRAYNVATGGVNTDTEGYHETLTRFYVVAIGQFLARQDGVRRDWPKLFAALLDSRLADKKLPLEFYSRDRIMSVEARREWVTPDLAEIKLPTG